MKTRIWPDDADGDVLRRLDENEFDFSQIYTIDFNVDFDNWPPSSDAIKAITQVFPSAELYSEGEEDGYVLFKISAFLTYELVIETQAKATIIAAPFGGRCESWGVLH